MSTGRSFRPPYVGYRGWVASTLDARTDWNELADLLRDAYVHVAPRKLAALLTHAGRRATIAAATPARN